MLSSPRLHQKQHRTSLEHANCFPLQRSTVARLIPTPSRSMQTIVYGTAEHEHEHEHEHQHQHERLTASARSKSALLLASTTKCSSRVSATRRRFPRRQPRTWHARRHVRHAGWQAGISSLCQPWALSMHTPVSIVPIRLITTTRNNEHRMVIHRQQMPASAANHSADC
jgi:hypothetical protein